MPGIVLETQHLVKRYGSLTAVKDLNLQVDEGEVFGLLGPNGAGKTTSINMICGLLEPDAGQVYLNGARVSSSDPRQLCQVGICPQEIIVWKQLTCLEQLVFIGEMYGMARAEAKQRGIRLLEDLDIANKRDQLARTLSGGMQRRLNLALALVHDPDLLILDEPEAGLDPQSRVKVREYIRALASRKTILLTTHNMDEAERVADRVAIIDYGELLVVDTPKALKRSLGEGDVLEIHLNLQASDPLKYQNVLSCMPNQVKASLSGNILTIRGLNVVAYLPAILDTLRITELDCGEVHLRPNTLEDVFIQLTGRRLRE